MATATVLKFMQKTAEDATLQQQLETLLGVGDGNISSEAELDAAESEALGELAPMVAQFAAQNGFTFSADELVSVVDAFQKHRAGDLSDEDFASLLGISLVGESLDNTPGVTNPIRRLSRYLTRTYLGY